MNILRFIVGGYFLTMGIIGLIGHLPRFQKNFRYLPAYQVRFGSRLGFILHFAKVCLLNFILAGGVFFLSF